MNLSATKSDERKMFVMKKSNESRLALQISHKMQRGSRQVIRRILHLTFDHSNDTLAMVNQEGELFIVNFANGKYWTLPVIVSCTIIKFSPVRSNELLFGSSNGNVTILNNIDGGIVEILTGHDNPVLDLSFTDNQCISWTFNEAILWNLNDNTKLHVLNLQEDASLNYAHLVPITNQIVACFKDNTIYVWKYETFDLVKKIPGSTWKYKINTVALTRNGRAMAIGGNSNEISIYLTELWDLVKTINVGKSVKKLEFVSRPFDGGSNRLLSILTSNGRLLFYDMQLDGIVDEIKCSQDVVKSTLSFDGKYVACNLSSGEVNVFHVKDYFSKRNTSITKKESIKSHQSIKSHHLLNVANIDVKAVHREMSKVLDVNKLKRILKLYGEYPENYRMTIWCKLLDLPKNINDYRGINDRLMYESSFTRIEQDYPLRDKSALKNLKKLLINLINWCPFFGNVTCLPLLVFPFVKIFKNEPTLLFEAVLTILINWCQHWFEYHPMLPVNVLAIVENQLILHDPDLVAHFATVNVTSKLYAWTLMETFFSEVTSANNWCTLWDHVLTNEPAFLLMLIVSYNITNRNVLMSMYSLDEYVAFYHKPHAYDLKYLLKKTYELMRTNDDHHPKRYLQHFKPLEKNSYPTYKQYPITLYEEETSQRQINQMNDENLLLSIETERLSTLKSLKAKEEANLLIEQTERKRLDELESTYKESLQRRRNDLIDKRETLTRLRKLMREEEVRLLSASTNQLQIKCCKDKQRTLRKLLDDLETNRRTTNLEVLNVESDIIEHYANILKSKEQIETLLNTQDAQTIDLQEMHPFNSDKNVLNDQKNMLNDKNILNEEMCLLNEEKYLLNEEIRRVQSCIDSKTYLKNLNLTSGLCALNKLIDRIERQIDKPTKSTNALTYETKELESEVDNLLKLMETSKITQSYVEFNEKFIKKHDLNDND